MRFRILGVGGACLGSAFALSALVTAPLAAQDVLSQAATYDTAIFSRTTREHSAQFASPLIVLDSATHTVPVALTNYGTAPLPVDLKLEFYKMTTDTAHNLTFKVVPSTATSRSLVKWVSGLPAKITIAPGATDTVTLTITPPATLEPGEYWGRILATSPTVHAMVPAVVRALTNQGDGVQPALVQQPTQVDFTMSMESSTKLVYRHGPVTTAMNVTTPKATWLAANGQVRTCATYAQTGSAAAMVAVRFSVRTAAGADTLVQPGSFELQGTQRVCMAFNAFALPPGRYTVALHVSNERTDLADALRSAFPAVDVTMPLVVPPGTTPRGAPKPPAPHVALSPKGVPIVELLPGTGKGTLTEQLDREAAQAAKDGKVALVEIGASWCGPCQAFLQALSSPSMVTALNDARVIRVDFDRWGTDFLGVSRYAFPSSLPAFFTLAPDGKQGTIFDVNQRWGALAQQYGGLDARVMAPTLKQFIAEEQSRMKANPVQ